MSYRDEARHVERESRWTFFRFLPLFVVVFAVMSVIVFAISSLGLIGRTIVEREVFEKSYQRSESLRSQIATDEATLAEIEMQLANPNLDQATRVNLEAQATAARLRIATTKRKQQ